ncbi:MAG: hypothetical protein R8P61_34155 [Bacteroidia bacterium]|nr:hypothetical protein [Bacteroidia bacterium]
MRKCFFSIIFLCSIAQAQSSWTWDDQMFALNVSQINEFITRFNGEAGPHIAEMQKGKDVALTRKDLVLSLFDRSAKMDAKSIRDFLEKIDEKDNKTLLSFYDEEWFARLECKILYKGKPERVTLTLKVESEKDYSSKWVIRGIDASFLRLNITEDEKLFLHPASEGTNFVNIRELFSADKRRVKGFLYQNFHEGKLALFLNELIEGNIEYEYIDRITYHFLQVENWAFMVHSVNRSDPNSGWLISDIVRLPEQLKSEYKKSILYLD